MKPGRKLPRRHHALTALLVLQVLLLFIGLPIASFGTGIPFASAALLVAAAVAILVSISPGVTSKLLGGGAILLGVAGAVFRIDHPTTTAMWLGHLSVFLAIVAVSLVVGRVVFGPGRVTSYRLQGAIVLYLNVGMAFASMYRLIADLSPGAFTGLNPASSEAAALSATLYFSFTTLTSTGFGDILPVHPMARSFANLEAILGQLYLATLLARLVTLHIASRTDRDEQM